MAKKFKTSFCYSFKRGDNLVLSSKSLSKLWVLREGLPPHEKWMLNKPIVIVCASMIELCLCEIFHRARFHTREGVPSLSEKQLRGLKITTRDEFGLYIAQCRQNRILGAGDIYGRLEKLRKLRNRVHIQNLDECEPKCEKQAFSDLEVSNATKLLEEVLAYVSTEYSRSKTYTEDVILVWD